MFRHLEAMHDSRDGLPIDVAEALEWLRREIDERLDHGKRRHTVARMMIDKLEQAARDRRAELAMQNMDAALPIGRQIDQAMAFARSRKMAGIERILLTVTAERELEDSSDPCVTLGERRRVRGFRGLPVETANGGVECALMLCDGGRFVWRIDLPRDRPAT